MESAADRGHIKVRHGPDKAELPPVAGRYPSLFLSALETPCMMLIKLNRILSFHTPLTQYQEAGIAEAVE
jgi:hypothetical protein